MRDERRSLGANYWKTVAGRGLHHLSDVYQSFLICPDDDAPLEVDPGRADDFVCPACKRSYAFRDDHLSALPGKDIYAASAERRKALDESARLACVSGHHGAPGLPDAWNLVEARLPNLTGKRVLDLCCGSGWGAVWFARQGAQVAAVDIVTGEGGLGTAITRADECRQSIDFFQVDACRLPFAAETFDVVFASAAIHVLPRPERMMMEAFRILRADGVMVNIGEPIHRGGFSPGPGGRDPRIEGRGLALGDYMAIYQEAGFHVEAVSTDESASNSGVAGPLRRMMSRSACGRDFVFVARRPKPLDLGKVLIPWRRGKRDERSGGNGG